MKMRISAFLIEGANVRGFSWIFTKFSAGIVDYFFRVLQFVFPIFVNRSLIYDLLIPPKSIKPWLNQKVVAGFQQTGDRPEMSVK